MERYCKDFYINKGIQQCLELGLLKENGKKDNGDILYKATIKAHEQAEMLAVFYMIYYDEIERLLNRIEELKSGIRTAIKDIDNYAYKFARDTLKETLECNCESEDK